MNKLRKQILQSSYEVGACHIGSALSCIDILVEIFKKKKEKDIFIFSKASGVCAYYVMLAEQGIIPHEKVDFFLKNYPLCSKEVPGVLFSTGSLGHGLPVAVGLALADRSRDVYVLMSDGEIQEGTTWESILFARQNRLKNLKIYVDRNYFQACGGTEDICGIIEALNYLNYLFPINIRRTVKAKGWPEYENRFESHYCNITKQQLDGLTKTIL
jgi:transketolase